MGARQVLRVAAGLVALCAVVATAHAEPGDEDIVVIELRPGDPAALRSSRAELIKELGGIAGIAVRADAGLDAALAGEASDQDAIDVRAALDEAREAFGALDCARATAAADRAIDLLAGRQAAGLDDGAALRASWAYVLLCADRDGDTARAQRAAQRLRALGVVQATDAGLTDAVWKKYPEIDASTEALVEVPITTEPAGAAVFVDHLRLGTSPATAHLAPGEHLIAAGESARRASVRVQVGSKSTPVTVALVDRTGTWSHIAGLVAGWRAGATKASGESLASLMQALDVRFALVLAGKDTVQVWALGPDDTKARKVDDGSLSETMAIGSMVLDRVAAWDGNAPDPDRPLLREGDAADYKPKGTPQRWWVYAAIVGAVVVGTSVLYFQDAADDHQTITIRF
jgi:hypothetical protein